MTYCERISKLKYARNMFVISLLILFCKISKNFLLILHVLHTTYSLWCHCALKPRETACGRGF